jgi:outer membrane protein assembly factor BamB
MIRANITLAFLILFAPWALADDWPQWLGPSRNNVSAETIQPWAEAPEIIWRKPVGNGFSTPVIADGRLFVQASVADQNQESVTAYDLKTGEEIWQQVYDRAPYFSQLGAGPRATPTVAEGVLVTIGITGELSCFDPATGDVRWRINPYRDNNISTPGFGVCSSPLVFENRVYVPIGGAGMAITAYDLKTGELAWNALDEPASASSPIVWRRAASDGSKTEVDLVVQTTLRIVGLDPANGDVRWEFPLVFEPSGVSPTPLIVGDRLVCTTQDTGTLALEFSGGETKRSWWDQALNSYFSTGTVGPDNSLLLVTNVVDPLPRTDLTCVNVVDGKPYWKQQGVGYFHIGVISLAENRVLVLTDAGRLVLGEATTTGLTKLCDATVCGGTFVNPVLSDGYFVARDDQEIVCVNLNAAE